LHGAGHVQDIAIMIGPEGGFEEGEVMKAKEQGWNVVTLGPRILRTETAGMAVLSAIMFYMEEME
jgi:RNA methyltransferase, RsmE family